MRDAFLIGHTLMAAGLLLSAGCSKEEPARSDVKPREAPTFEPGAGTQPAATLPAGHTETETAGLPPGHPPIGATPAPAAGGQDAADVGLKIDFPDEWQRKPARTMTLQVLAAPRAQGDPEDADIALSELRTRVALQMNIDRWCGQFELPEGQTCATAARQETLEGTRHPTTIVEIEGSFKGRSMFAASGAPRPGYKMVAIEIVTPDRPYYVTMVGPKKTVEKWQPPLLDAVKRAE